MTTKRSSLRALKDQADKIAKTLKAFERGEVVDIRFAEKLLAARGKPTVTFGIVMDDKIIKLEMPWAIIHSTSEIALSAFILKQMKESRDAVH